MKTPTFYTLGTAAKALGVTKPTVKNWIDGGELPATRNDKNHYQIQRVDLERLYPDKLHDAEAIQANKRQDDTKKLQSFTPKNDTAIEALNRLIDEIQKGKEKAEETAEQWRTEYLATKNLLDDKRTEAEKAAKKLVDIELAAPVIKRRKVSFMDWLRGRELAEVEEVA